MDVKSFLKSKISDGKLLDELLDEARERWLTEKDVEEKLQILSRDGIIKYYYKSLEYKQRISIKNNEGLLKYVG